MDSSLKDILAYIVAALVDDPSAIDIQEKTVESESGLPETTLELRVAKADMGKIIGRQGRIAREIRTIMRTSANLESCRVNVEIVD